MLVSRIDWNKVDAESICRYGKITLLRVILKKGLVLSEWSLWEAVYADHLEVVQELIKHNAPVHPSCLYWAAYNGNLEIVKELIRYKAPVDEDAVRVSATEDIKEVLIEYVGRQS